MAEAEIAPVASVEDGGKERKKKTEKFKVVLRRLPPYITWEELKEQLEPLPPTEYISFCPADLTFAPHAFARCYFVFTNEQDVYDFSDKFNRYVFVDKKGYDSAAMVELAMYQKVPRRRREDMGKDTRCGIIEQEVEYLRFVDELEAIRNTQILTLEEQLRNVNLTEMANKAGAVQETPLTQFLVKLYGAKALKKDERRKEKIERMNKMRVSAAPRERERESRPSTSRPSAAADKDNAENVMRKLGIGKKNEDLAQSKKTPAAPRNPAAPREKPARSERRERPPRNAGDKKKDRPEREIYRPGQRNRPKGGGEGGGTSAESK